MGPHTFDLLGNRALGHYLQDSCLAFSSSHEDDGSSCVQHRKCEGHTLWWWLWGVTNGGYNLLPLLGEEGRDGDRRSRSLQLHEHSHTPGMVCWIIPTPPTDPVVLDLNPHFKMGELRLKRVKPSQLADAN